MLEQAYEHMQTIEYSFQNIKDIQDEYSQEKSGPLYESYDAYSAQNDQIAFERSIAKEVGNIEDTLGKIDLFVNLYLTPLHDIFSKYQFSVDNLVEAIKFGKFPPEEECSKANLKKLGRQLKLSLSNLLKERGYSYL